MTEFGIGDEHPVVDERAADTRSESGQDDEAGHILCGAVSHLGYASGIRIIDESDVAVKRLLEQLLSLESDPLLRDICGGHRPAVDHDGRETYPDRNVLVDLQLIDDLDHGVHDVIRLAAARRRKFDALTDQLARRGVDQSTLDTRTADVDANCLSHAVVLLS